MNNEGLVELERSWVLVPKKKEPDCTQCHEFCRINGRPACTNTPQSQGTPPYKFLKSLKPCADFWRAHA